MDAEGKSKKMSHRQIRTSDPSRIKAYAVVHMESQDPKPQTQGSTGARTYDVLELWGVLSGSGGDRPESG